MATYTPEQVESYFITKVDDMPKMCDHQTKPNYNTVDEFQQKLDKNLMAIPVVTGNFGFLGVVINTTEYTTISGGTLFIAPTDPGILPPDPSSIPRSTADEKATYTFQVQESIRLFNQTKQEFNKYISMKALVQKIILGSIGEKYTNHL